MRRSSTSWNNVLEKLQEFIDGRIHHMNFGKFENEKEAR
jgi:hypothetical protein